MLRSLVVTSFALLGASLLASAAIAQAPSEARTCISVDRVTTFAPRGQVYVEVQAQCTPDHFAAEDPIVAYLEVLVGDAPAVGEDVRVYASQPTLRSTIEFTDLDFASGDSILVRLSRFGVILGIQSVKAP